MKFKLPTIAAALCVGIILSPPVSAQDAEKPTSLEDRISYAYGIVVARDLKERGVPIQKEQFLAAFASVFSDEKSLLSDTEISRASDENQLRNIRPSMNFN